MDYLLIFLGAFLIIGGIIGSFLPVIPGPPTGWLGLLCLHLTDTIKVQLTVNIKGFFSCKEVLMTDDLNYFFPDLRDEVKQMIKNLPMVEPAQKRGIPVLSNYRISVVIETDDSKERLETEIY